MMNKRKAGIAALISFTIVAILHVIDVNFGSVAPSTTGSEP